MIHTIFFWTFLLSYAVLSSSASPLSSTHCPTLREQGKIVQSLIYNRVTKTASSTMQKVIGEAEATNGFTLLNLPPSPNWKSRDMPTIVVHDQGASHLCTKQEAVARGEKYFCVRDGEENMRKIVVGHLGHRTMLRLLGPSLVNNTAIGHMNIVRHPVLREQSSFNYMLGRRTCNGHNSLKMNTSSACCCRLTIYRECVNLWEANRCKLAFSAISNSQAYFLGRQVRDYTMVGLTEALPQSIELMADLFPQYFGHVDLKHGIPHAKISDKAENSALSIEVTQLLLRQASTQEELDLYALTVYRFWNTYMSCKPQYQSWREAMRSAWAEGMLSLHGIPAIAPGVEELLYSDMMKRIAKLEAIQQGT